MPAFTITRAAAATARKPRQPKASIRTSGGLVLELPFAPREQDHDGLADTYATLARPGRKPLVVDNGEGLRTTSFDVYLAHRDPTRPVEGMLTTLKRIADSGDRVTLSRLGGLATGVVWNLTGAQVKTELMAPGTNAITRATVSLTFTEAVDATVHVGPLTGGKKPRKGKKRHHDTGGKGGKGKATTQHYTVRRGDTLSRIALKFYGDPNRWQLIAKASHVRDPRRLKIGARLTIPPA